MANHGPEEDAANARAYSAVKSGVSATQCSANYFPVN